jgi:glutamyl-tRNA synthetase
LAKRHGGSHLDTYRQAGIRPQRIIGLLGKWCGTCSERQELDAEEFRAAFSLDKLDRKPVAFTVEDHQWLMDSRSVC